MASDAAAKIAAKHNETLPKAGHNSDPSGSIKSYVDRLQKLEEEKAVVGEDIKELKSEMKEHHINPAAVARIVKEQMEDAEKRAKRLALAEQVDQYKHALGLLD